MNWKLVLKATSAAALGLMLAACGGGGGSSQTVEVGGTAATGAALAGAAVEVKCQEGGGSATTTSTGAYTVTMQGATLPCIVRVTGTTGSGATITLHSIVESGSGSGNTTTATANVTPVTEMIVAQLMAALPGEAFDSFDASRVTTEAVKQALTVIVDALKTAGIDLGGIDPLKADLVPANGSTAGNAYDQLLDQLGETVPPEALPQVVNQIANAAGSGSSEGLQDAMAGVQGGTLAGCPSAISGRYRTQEFFGRVQVRNLDFKNMTFATEGQSGTTPITQDATDACKFKVTATVEGVTSEFEAVIGPQGAGSFKAVRSSNPPGTTGYIFPLQSHPVSAFVGDWSYVQSGGDPDDGLIHWFGRMTMAADGKMAFCDYDGSGNCQPDSEVNATAGARGDGGVDLNEPSEGGVASLWGFKAPNGSFTIFGTTNASGATDADVAQTHIVAARVTRLSLPAVGAVNKAWSAVLRQTGNRSTRTVTAPTGDTNTVTSVNAAQSSYTRDLDGAAETIYVNSPADGFRKRQNSGGAWFVQLPLVNSGLTVGFNAGEGLPYTHIISVNKP